MNKKEWRELEEFKKQNREERMKFIDMYTDWLKKTPNKVWARQQNKLLNK